MYDLGILNDSNAFLETSNKLKLSSVKINHNFLSLNLFGICNFFLII